MIKTMLCFIFNHEFYAATSECDSTRCKRCGKWFKMEDAYGRWV